MAIAEKVRSEYQAGSARRIWIAASLGAYGAMLHNGAEYHGNYDCGFDELVGFHRRRIAVLAETMPTSWLLKASPRSKRPKLSWPRYSHIRICRFTSALRVRMNRTSPTERRSGNVRSCSIFGTRSSASASIARAPN